MKNIRFKGMFILLILSLSFAFKIFAQEDKVIAETVVHLLSYVGMDYSGAVQEGEIIDQMEYDEQLEFSTEAYKFTEDATFLSEEEKGDILAKMSLLIQKIEDKVHEDEISQ